MSSLPFPARRRWFSAFRAAAVAGAALAVILLLGRMAVEWHWFGQFELQSVLLRRWGLQLVAFVLVFGGGSLLQL